MKWKNVSGIAGMLKKTRQFFFLFTCLSLVYGCHTMTIPSRYSFTPVEACEMYSGSWIQIKYNTSNNQQIELSGELIAVEKDTIFILTEVQFVPVDTLGIKKAVLYIFRRQYLTGPLVGLLTYMPNIIGVFTYVDGSYFLLLGAPALITGIVFGLLETGNKEILVYPGRDNIGEFEKFARFPQGLPPDLKRNELCILR